MTDTIPNAAHPIPMHLWIVGVLSLLWNGVGAYDYLMTQTENATYMASFTPEQLDFFYGFPAWVVAAWAIAVWGSVLGSILLLLRKSLAVPVFGVVLVAMALTAFHNFFLENGIAIMGGAGTLAFTTLIWIVAILLFLYARRMRALGVLT